MVSLRPLLFDSSQLQFHPDIFLKQLAIHLFMPFTIWLSPNLTAQGLDCRTFRGTFFNYVTHALVVVMMVCGYLSPTAIEGNLGAIWPPLMLYVTHRAMVSLKYATLSSSEYKRFMGCRDLDTLNGYIGQMQIGNGMFNGNRDQLQYEIAASAARLRIVNLQKLRFLIPTRVKQNTDRLNRAPSTKKFRLNATADEVKLSNLLYPSDMKEWEAFITPAVGKLWNESKQRKNTLNPTKGEREHSINSELNSEVKAFREIEKKAKIEDGEDVQRAASPDGDGLVTVPIPLECIPSRSSSNVQVKSEKIDQDDSSHKDDGDDDDDDDDDNDDYYEDDNRSVVSVEYAAAHDDDNRYNAQQGTAGTGAGAGPAGPGNYQPSIAKSQSHGVPKVSPKFKVVHELKLTTKNSVPVTLTYLAVILESRKRVMSRYRYPFLFLVLLFTVSLAVQPFIIVYEDPWKYVNRHNIHNPASPACSVLFYVCSSLLLLVYTPIIVMFLATTILDMLVRRNCAILLGDMIRTYRREDNSAALFFNIRTVDNDVIDFNHLISPRCEPVAVNRRGESARDGISKRDAAQKRPITNDSWLSGPLLDIEGTTKNIEAWINLRMLMQNYAARFRFRFDIYIAALILCAFVIMVSIAVKIAATNAEASENMSSSVEFRQCLIAVGFITLFVATNILIGARTNVLYSHHMKGIIGHMSITNSRIVHCHAELRDLKRTERECINAVIKHSELDDVQSKIDDVGARLDRYSSIMDNLNLAKDAVEQVDLIFETKVFGVQCSYSYAYTVISTVFIFYVYLYTMTRPTNIDAPL